MFALASKHTCVLHNEHSAVKLLVAKPRGRSRIADKAAC